MVGHLENFGHPEKNICDHNFVTNCDILLIMSENKCVCYFKNCV